MSGERPKTPKVTLTADSEDITEKERSPAEEAFCESFLIQSRSAVGNMYASNIYHSQKHAKELKDLERQRYFQMSQMTTKQKEMLKKMNQLQDRQEQIMTEKRKQHLKVAASKGRLRPMSTSAISDGERKLPKARARSGSLTSLQPLDLSLSSQRFSKSTQDLSDPSLLSSSLPANILSKSCENLSALGTTKKMVLPAIPKCQRSKSCDDDEEDTDSTFITRLPPSPPAHPKFNSNLSKFSPERRRGSLELDRKLDLDRRRANGKFDDSSTSTQTKWVPKSHIRSLPPL